MLKNFFTGQVYAGKKICSTNCDSYAQTVARTFTRDGDVLTTVEIRLPRIILPELLTHRKFSRNFQSTRAFPTMKLIWNTMKSPFKPIIWGSNKPGMAAGEELGFVRRTLAKLLWRSASFFAALHAMALTKVGLHKQWAGRVIEPYSYTTGVVSATDWDNFDWLRIHEAAQPEIKDLALIMNRARLSVDPVLASKGEMHLPYLADWEHDALSIFPEKAMAISSARCARATYLKLGTSDESKWGDDLRTFVKLISSDRLHGSPMEHQAIVALVSDPAQRGNFSGDFEQFRYQIARLVDSGDKTLIEEYTHLNFEAWNKSYDANKKEYLGDDSN